MFGSWLVLRSLDKQDNNKKTVKETFMMHRLCGFYRFKDGQESGIEVG